MDKLRVLSPTLQDYIEAIWRLIAEKGAAHAGDIADALGVHKSTVTAALKKLSDKQLIEYSPYYAVTLTAKGSEMGQEIARRHEALSRFLTETLAVDSATAEQNACRLEHVLDREVLRRMSMFGQFVRDGALDENWLKKFREYLANHKEAPAAKAGSGKNMEEGVPMESTPTTLDKMKPGQKGKILRVRAVGAVTRRIVDMGVIRGTPIEVVKIAPLGDPIEVKVKGYNLSLRKEEAAAVQIEIN